MKFSFFHILMSLILALALMSEGNAVTLVPNIATQMKKEEKQAKTIIRLQKVQEKKIAREAIQTKKNTPSQKTPQITLIPTVTPTIKTNTSPSTSKNPVNTITYSAASSIPNVDIDRVRSEWLKWYNDIRAKEWLSPYTYDARLDVTAHAWNIEFAKWRWQNHHRRSPNDSYYDYLKLEDWFADRGVNAKVINRTTLTENVGYGSYSCGSGDCTDRLIRSIRGTFDFFLSEKGKSYNPHYRSIVQPNFQKVGIDIISVPSEGRYYITVHFATEIK